MRSDRPVVEQPAKVNDILIMELNEHRTKLVLLSAEIESMVKRTVELEQKMLAKAEAISKDIHSHLNPKENPIFVLASASSDFSKNTSSYRCKL